MNPDAFNKSGQVTNDKRYMLRTVHDVAGLPKVLVPDFTGTCEMCMVRTKHWGVAVITIQDKTG